MERVNTEAIGEQTGEDKQSGDFIMNSASDIEQTYYKVHVTQQPSRECMFTSEELHSLS